jgi:rfaE bifunctional protein kinase chain/domain
LVKISESRFDELLRSCVGKRIAVVGDLMLDRYVWGTVSRISPEAPVPVVDVDDEQSRLGGAANVARNVRALGGEPLLVGVIGDDGSGKQLLQHIRDFDFPTGGVVVDPQRPTTIKTRIIAHGQHVVRIDRESRKEIAPSITRQIIDILASRIDAVDGIIIEDYNKGVVTTDLIRQVIELANRHGKIITVDPKFNNFFEYRNVTLFKPNRKEVEEALGVHLSGEPEVTAAGKELLHRLNAKSVLITRGEQGMTLLEQNGTVSHVPTMARNVADVSGAGDTVIATLTMALAAGARVNEASALANFAGGIVCGYVGIVPVDVRELRSAVIADHATEA